MSECNVIHENFHTKHSVLTERERRERERREERERERERELELENFILQGL